MFRTLLFVALSGACAPGSDLLDASLDADRVATTCEPLGGTPSGVTFTDEEGQNAVDFADNASLAELEALRGVGPSIADRIVRARPFGTQADPLAALDAVSYVGPEVLRSFRDDSAALWCFLDDGRQSCCLDIGCEGIGGVVESDVEVDDAQAHMLLDWANRADWEQLVEVCEAGPTIAEGLLAARPIRTVYDLADVPYVGSHTIQAFLGHPDSRCATQGSVAETWCASPEAECVCEAGVPQDIWTDDVADLPEEVQDIVDGYAIRSAVCDDQRRPWYPRFLEATIHTAGGIPTGYSVRLLQTIDPEGGIQYLIEVEISADFDVVDLDCSI